MPVIRIHIIYVSCFYELIVVFIKFIYFNCLLIIGLVLLVYLEEGYVGNYQICEQGHLTDTVDEHT